MQEIILIVEELKVLGSEVAELYEQADELSWEVDEFLADQVSFEEERQFAMASW